MRRKWKLLCICTGMLLSVLSGCKQNEAEIPLAEPVDMEENEAEPSGEEMEDAALFVYVCGAVAREGVYELPQGSRLFAALEAAGGMTEEAESRFLNQAEALTDGQKIYVPTKEEAAAGEGQIASPEDEGKVNLNTATEEELCTLPGIGEAKAAAILKFREEKGAFASIEELKEVEGIKDGVFQKVKDLVMI